MRKAAVGAMAPLIMLVGATAAYAHVPGYSKGEQAGKIFCLVEADSADDASTVHREAPGSPRPSDAR